jgi:hypothetical protein
MASKKALLFDCMLIYSIRLATDSSFISIKIMRVHDVNRILEAEDECFRNCRPFLIFSSED